MVAHISPETAEVVLLLAGSISKKIIGRKKCNECECLMTTEKKNDVSINKTTAEVLYFN